MRTMFTGAVCCCALLFAFSAPAQTARKATSQPSKLTYDPMATMGHVALQWDKDQSSFPEDQHRGEYLKRLLTRLPNERDESYAFRLYFFYGADKNLSQAAGAFNELERSGFGDSHRWLYVAEAKGRMLFVDLKTAVVGDTPSVWVQERKLGTLLSTSKWEIRCGAREMRTLTYSEYGADGRPNITISDPTSWEPVYPGSVSEGVLEFSCS